METAAINELAEALGVDEHGGPGDLLDRVRQMRADLEISNRVIGRDSGLTIGKIRALAEELAAASGTVVIAKTVTSTLCAALDWQDDGTGRQLEPAANAAIRILAERNTVIEGLSARLRDNSNGRETGMDLGKVRTMQAALVTAVERLVAAMGWTPERSRDAGIVGVVQLITDAFSLTSEALTGEKADRGEAARVLGAGPRETATSAARRVVSDLAAARRNEEQWRAALDDAGRKIAAALRCGDRNIATIIDAITRLQETIAHLTSETASTLAIERKAHAETREALKRMSDKSENCEATADAVAAKLGAILGWSIDRACGQGLVKVADRLAELMANLGQILAPVHAGTGPSPEPTSARAERISSSLSDAITTAAHAVAELRQLRAERAEAFKAQMAEYDKQRADQRDPFLDARKLAKAHAKRAASVRISNCPEYLRDAHMESWEPHAWVIEAIIEAAQSGLASGPISGSRPVLHIAIASLITAMSTDPRDWSKNPTDAWLYGVIVGWTSHDLAAVVEQHGMAESAEAIIGAANSAVSEFLAARP